MTDWNRDEAAHLLRRAGFGAPRRDVERAVRRGRERTIDSASLSSIAMPSSRASICSMASSVRGCSLRKASRIGRAAARSPLASRACALAKSSSGVGSTSPAPVPPSMRGRTVRAVPGARACTSGA